MKQQVLKNFWSVFCLLPLFFAGCSDDEEVPTDEILQPELFEELSCPFEYDETDTDNVFGKWKLVRTENGNTITDYSCSNVTYEFTADGRLIIESDVAAIPDSVYTYKGGTNQSSDPLGMSNGNMTLNDTLAFFSETSMGRLSVGPVQGEAERGGLICSYRGYLLRMPPR